MWRCLVAGAAVMVLAAPAGAKSRCQPGDWVTPGTGARTGIQAVMARALKSRVVLLGETHTEMEHHRWQAYMLAALHASHPRLVVGFEMFPRAAQPVLDKWTAGALDEAAFLAQSRWNDVWGYHVALYRPLLYLVRDHRLKAIALNVDSGLVSRVGRQGWAAIPEAERQGVTPPAPASEPYRRSLAEVYAEKMRRGIGRAAKEEHPDIGKILKSDAFSRFVRAQLAWDRAMAVALADAVRADPGALVVGIVGRGHVEFGYGIPHQLADLGVTAVTTLIPSEPKEACDKPAAGLADALFIVSPAKDAGPAPAKPMLGVMIGPAKDGVQVRHVVPGSVAAASKLEEGDVITEAAGFKVSKIDELIGIIQRQAPGTWLPLRIRRGDGNIDIIAKFPQSFDGR